eukprot:GHVR01100961.1.p1 GENE.GHVR01100961.1~~GHVR01100961.1.p1  ORF type:complete len:215 (+),score=-10.72 GHVR01100961.1:2625-3269(+)
MNRYQSFCISFGALVYRSFLNTIRNPLIVKSRIFQTIILSLFVGGLYFQIEDEYFTNGLPNSNWLSMLGFLFFFSMNNLMTSLTPVSLTFPSERDVFLKEQGSRMYGVNSYFFSRNVIEIPYLIIIPMIASLILYWMVGLSSTARQFFEFYFIAFLISFAGNSLGLLIGSIFSDTKLVSAATPTVILPFVLFSGFFKTEMICLFGLVGFNTFLQ